MSNYNPDFDWWLIRATKGIKYRPDRQEVYGELYQHIEDRYLDFLEQGMKEEEAEENALRVMGDADEIAPQLAAIHRPFWGYLYSLCKWGFIVLSVVTLLKAVPWWRSYYDDIQEPTTLAYGLALDLNPYEDVSYEVIHDGKLQYTFNRVFYAQPDCKASSDGYTFSISNVALWSVQEDDQTVPEPHEYLYIQMDVSNPLPWADFTGVPRWFWAEDSLGNYYYSYFEHALRGDGLEEYTNPEPHLTGNIYKTDFGTYTYNIWLRGIDFHNTEWISLRYDRSDRDIVLRINLTGGDTP